MSVRLYVCLYVLYCIVLHLYCIVSYCIVIVIVIVLYCMYVYVYGLCIFMACTYKASVWCSTSWTCLMPSGYQTGWISATKCRNWVRNNGWLGQRNSTGQPNFALIVAKNVSGQRYVWIWSDIWSNLVRTELDHGWCCSQQFLVIILIIWIGVSMWTSSIKLGVFHCQAGLTKGYFWSLVAYNNPTLDKMKHINI